jgi:hypothetical protein
MRKTSLLLFIIFFLVANPALTASSELKANGDKELITMSSLPFISQDFDEEEDFWDEEWDDEDWDEDWDDEDWDEEPAIKKEPKFEAVVKPPVAAQEAIAEDAVVEEKPFVKSQDELDLEVKIKAEIASQKAKQDNNFIKLADTFKRSPDEFRRLYSKYGELLNGLNPDNPKDLKEIEKLIEIVVVPKR